MFRRHSSCARAASVACLVYFPLVSCDFVGSTADASSRSGSASVAGGSSNVPASVDGVPSVTSSSVFVCRILERLKRAGAAAVDRCALWQ